MSSTPARPLAALKSALRQLRADKHHARYFVTAAQPTVPGRPVNFHPGAIMTGRSTTWPSSLYTSLFF
jgi:large subunit ribosomal protein L19